MSMPETISIYAESIEDISPINHDSLSIDLSGVDLAQLISEIGEDIILAEIGKERIEQYFADLEDEENGE